MASDDLYGLPLDRFVAERGALAKRLRAEGRRDEAAEVAKARKPSVPAWVVNQLVRTAVDAVAELLAAGDALRAAQEQLLAGGGDARALRDAGARERAAVEALVEAARGLLEEPSAATLDRVADTLHAAALDQQSREAVRGGRLERELRHAGLGLGEGTAPAPARAAAPAAAASASLPKLDGEAERRAAKERAAAEKAERAEREAARKRSRAAVAKAAKAAERAGHALRAAQERRDRAVQALQEADAALAEARERADAAEAEHRRAREALDGR